VNIQLVLSHYLAGLRERDELDALLPELLMAMGHSVLSRPQLGVAQAGVDVVSTMENDKGVLEVFLFVIKFGDIGREDFYGGKQSIDSSVREAANDFVRNRLTEPLRDLRKRIVLLTNGVVKQEVQAGFSALSHDVAERPQCSLELWGSYQLSPLIERHLFDDALLLGAGKSDLRAALAGLEDSETSIRRFIRFLNSCFPPAEEELTEKISAQKRKFLKRCASAAMGWSVLLVWGQNEDNLKPGVVAGEYLILRLWAEAVRLKLTDDTSFKERFQNLVLLHVKALHQYYVKIAPQLLNQRALLKHRPNRLLYAQLVFEEMGRLATFLLLIQRIEGMENLREETLQLMRVLLNTHTGCHLPVYDGQSIDLTLLLVAFMGEKDWVGASQIVRNCTERLLRAVKTNQYLPVDTDLLEDAVLLFSSEEADGREFFKTSTLVPALAAVAAFLGDDVTLSRLREDVGPHMKEVTLERWFPTAELETLTGSNRVVQDVGVSCVLTAIRATAQEESEASVKPFPQAAGMSDFKWHSSQMTVLAALSARLHRHPVPTWFIAEYAAQLVGSTRTTH